MNKFLFSFCFTFFFIPLAFGQQPKKKVAPTSASKSTQQKPKSRERGKELSLQEIQPLLAGLSAKKPKVRAAFLKKLMTLGPRVSKAIPLLLRMLESKKVGYQAALILGKVGEKAVDALIPLLKKTRYKARLFVLLATAMNGERAYKAVPTILKALQRENKTDRKKLPALEKDPLAYHAILIKSLGAMKKSAKQIIPVLQQTLQHKILQLRLIAGLNLLRLDPKNKFAIPVLIEGLAHKKASVRKHIASVLFRLGKSGIPHFLFVLSKQQQKIRLLETKLQANKQKKNSLSTRKNLVLALLDALDKPGKKSIPVLMRALNTSEQEIRKQAMITLGHMGKKAIPALMKALQSKHWLVRLSAAKALASMGKDAIPALVQGLLSKHRWVRSRSSYALGKMGAKAIPTLLRVVVFAHQKKNASLRMAVRQAFVLMSLEDLPLLVKALQHKHPVVRYDISESLSKLSSLYLQNTDEMQAIFVPAFVRLLKDKNDFVRGSAVAAMSKLGQHAKNLRPLLEKTCAKESSKYVRGVCSKLRLKKVK